VDRRFIFASSLASAVMIFIALAFLHPVKAQKGLSLPGAIGLLQQGGSDYAGSQACAACHQNAFHDWARSHHAWAMAEANRATVRGDFNQASIDHAGSRGRFFEHDGRFMMETENKSGTLEAFPIDYVFGLEPLQQYMTRFADGRVQVLPWAWDTRPKEAGGQRWFHVYGDEPIPASDTRHWTRGQQNWNYMCAECHSTDVKKNYNLKDDQFQTTFSEISVGCEACHGPARKHIAWAESGHTHDPLKGFVHQAGKRAPIDWSIDPQTGNPKQSVGRPDGDEVETCARCHSRRSMLSEDWKPGRPIEVTHLPAFLSEGLFEADGTMKDEVFNDHSFKQSLMYAKGVVCSDCHEPHSAKLKAEGAQICGQCHDNQKFSSIRHTGHSDAAGNPSCIDCHMPARTYMVIDKRHDHSFRIPRPDLSHTTGAPNACQDCHINKTSLWAADAIKQWHGPNRKSFQDWGETFATARKGDPAARAGLIALINDPKKPAIIRATALDEVSRFPSQDALLSAEKALQDPAPLIRVAAIRVLAHKPAEQRIALLAPLLSDPVRAVRLEATTQLGLINPQLMSAQIRSALERAQEELAATHRLNADRPEARAAYAQLFMQQGRLTQAEQELQRALQLQPDAASLAVNLADLYRAIGQEEAAHRTLVDYIKKHPDSAIAHHALGLSLVRQKKHQDAMAALKKAYELEPQQARYAFVYGVALQSAGHAEAGRAILEKAHQAAPWNIDLNNALLADALRNQDVSRAALYAKTLTALKPDDAALARLSNMLNQ
jgi:predicted CXXCH cytochrome family protein